jgi:hypothetical protein
MQKHSYSNLDGYVSDDLSDYNPEPVRKTRGSLELPKVASVCELQEIARSEVLNDAVIIVIKSELISHFEDVQYIESKVQKRMSMKFNTVKRIAVGFDFTEETKFDGWVMVESVDKISYISHIKNIILCQGEVKSLLKLESDQKVLPFNLTLSSPLNFTLSPSGKVFPCIIDVSSKFQGISTSDYMMKVKCKLYPKECSVYLFSSKESLDDFIDALPKSGGILWVLGDATITEGYEILALETDVSEKLKTDPYILMGSQSHVAHTKVNVNEFSLTYGLCLSKLLGWGNLCKNERCFMRERCHYLHKKESIFP